MSLNHPVSPEVIERPIEAVRLDGRVAVVIGGTGVLCGAIARTFASAGAHAILVGRDESKAQNTLSKIEAAGAQATFLPCDATEPLALVAPARTGSQGSWTARRAGQWGWTQQLYPLPRNRLGRAGPSPGRQLQGRVSLLSGLRGVLRRAGSRTRNRRIDHQRRISVWPDATESCLYLFCGQAAVHNLSANLAREWAPYGIRVNTLVPGFFPAEQNRRILTQARIESVLAHTPAGRFGEPQELVGAALLLASDAGSFITGAELVVDGGFSKTTI